MMHISEDAIPAPVRTPETAAFWDAANEKRLVYAECQDCGKPHYYPRRICPFCFSSNVDWKDTSGLATLYAFSFFRKGSPPYVSAWVTLDEGVTVLTNVTDCDAGSLRIGDRVEVVFKSATDGQLTPLFRPLQSPNTKGTEE